MKWKMKDEIKCKLSSIWLSHSLTHSLTQLLIVIHSHSYLHSHFHSRSHFLSLFLFSISSFQFPVSAKLETATLNSQTFSHTKFQDKTRDKRNEGLKMERREREQNRKRERTREKDKVDETKQKVEREIKLDSKIPEHSSCQSIKDSWITYPTARTGTSSSQVFSPFPLHHGNGRRNNEVNQEEKAEK